jgi:xanthine dehydrogenase accessory factor
MFIEVLIAQTRGSSPREAGTRMWVSATEVHGTIGGGSLEFKAVDIARHMLSSSLRQSEHRFALGDSLGQCCGGSVTLRFRTVTQRGAEPPQFHVVLYGAGHVGSEVARILERLPCRLTWFDSRPEMAQPGMVIEEEPAWMVDQAPRDALHLVMTHSHALDLEIVERVLRRGDFSFLGLIGSQTKAAKFRARLRARGLDPSALVCPVGVFKAGKHPAEIAVSAVAQILERRSHVPVGRALESVPGA